MRLGRIQVAVLLLSVVVIALGVLDGEYDVVRDFVRFICTSCIGLG